MAREGTHPDSERFRNRARRWLTPPLISLSMAAIAGGSGWTETTTIAELTPSSRHRYTVRLNLTDNPNDCRSKNTFYQDYSANGSDQMFRTLLEAIVSAKRVRVLTTGRCELNGYGEISSVSILP